MDPNPKKTTMNDSATTFKPNEVENNVCLRLQSCSSGLANGLQDGKGNLVFNSPSLELPLHVLQNVKPGQRVRIILPSSMPILVREATGEFKILFGHPNLDPNVPLSANLTSSTPNMPSSSGFIQPGTSKTQNGSLGKTDSGTQTSYDPGWTSAVFPETPDQFKNELRCLTKSFDELKDFLMTKNQEQEIGKENINSHFAFEAKQPSKKIKMEMAEDLCEEIQKLKEEVGRQSQIIKNLKEDNFKLYKEVSDLKWL